VKGMNIMKKKNTRQNLVSRMVKCRLDLAVLAFSALAFAACSGVEHAPDSPQEDGSVVSLTDANVEGGVADGGGLIDATTEQDGNTATVDAATGQDGNSSTVDAATGQDGNTSTVDAATASCQSDRQCETGSICLNGSCVEGCRINEDCPSDSPKCELGAAAPGSCVECLVGTDCQAPLNACVNGSCTQTCANPGDCDFPLVCDDSQGLCVRCINDDQCLSGNICETNDCVPGCRNDDNCQNGDVCINGACLAGCRDDSGCLDGMICIASACQLGCRPTSA